MFECLVAEGASLVSEIGVHINNMFSVYKSMLKIRRTNHLKTTKARRCEGIEWTS